MFTLRCRMEIQSNIVDKQDSELRSILSSIKYNGYHKSSICLMAKRVGEHPETTYHYFPGKCTLRGKRNAPI